MFVDALARELDRPLEREVIEVAGICECALEQQQLARRWLTPPQSSCTGGYIRTIRYIYWI
jgi:hypothetical protein